jgi:hypothetical protein
MTASSVVRQGGEQGTILERLMDRRIAKAIEIIPTLMLRWVLCVTDASL